MTRARESGRRNSRPPRVALVASHPIQYHVPWYQALHREVSLRVIYGCNPGAREQGTGFGVAFNWDIPMLEGYEWEVLPEDVTAPDLASFNGVSGNGIGAAITAFNPDAMILTGWHARMLVKAWAVALRKRIPCLVRGENNLNRPRGMLNRAAQRVFLRSFSAFLAIGRANRDYYLANGVPARRIFDCPYFIDNERFHDQAGQIRSQRAGIRSQWHIPGDATCFLFSGKLISKKRPGDLLEAVQKLGPATGPVHVLVAGDGPLRTELEALTAQWKLPVTFAGFLNQTEITRAYVATDCLVLPSDHGETWGLVVNEAMACGLPAVVSDKVGCAPDLIVPGKTGYTYSCGNIGELAELLARLATDRAGLEQMGRAAYKHVRQTCTVESAVQGTLAALDFVHRGVPAAADAGAVNT